MRAKKDPQTGKWYVQYRYTDWQDIKRKSTKRGFATKREAEEWARQALMSKQADFNMNFEEFIKLYYADMEPRLRENTMRSKRYIIDLKIIPYFGKKSVSSIKPADIRCWQNEMMSRDYSPTYLRTISNQITAIFNYAVKYYDLQNNPCKKAGGIGKNRADEMNFWTKDEFALFIDEVADKHLSYVAFNILFWAGIRIGELLALTVGDVDYEGKTLNVDKSYQRFDGRDVITPPKTPKGKRRISIPEFLVDELKDYIDTMYDPKPINRLFPVTKSYFSNEMKRGSTNAGVKRITIHNLRHSHCALLFELGFSALEIAQRLGHERIENTLQTYAHLYPDKQKFISDKLDKLYKEEFYVC